jgi:hypothetical protein
MKILLIETRLDMRPFLFDFQILSSLWAKKLNITSPFNFPLTSLHYYQSSLTSTKYGIVFSFVLLYINIYKSSKLHTLYILENNSVIILDKLFFTYCYRNNNNNNNNNILGDNSNELNVSLVIFPTDKYTQQMNRFNGEYSVALFRTDDWSIWTEIKPLSSFKML